jgi:hypothetical protein
VLELAAQLKPQVARPQYPAPSESTWAWQVPQAPTFTSDSSA